MLRKLFIVVLLSSACMAQSVMLSGTSTISGTVTLGAVTSSGGSCGGVSYLFSIAVTLPKAVNSDQTIAVPITFQDSRFATVANGGNVQNTVSNSLSRTVPADWQFCPDNTGTSTPMKFETESYDGTYGIYAGWLKVDPLHSATQDTVYLYTNNASVTTDQEDLSMWLDLSYALVLHFPNGATLDMKDSSGNANHGTMHGTVPATKDGAFGGAAGNSTTSGSWSNSNYVKIPASSSYKQTNNVTWEAWALSNGGSNSATAMSLDYHANGTWASPYGSVLSLDGHTTQVDWIVPSSGSLHSLTSTNSLIGFAGKWEMLNATYNGSTAKVFIDGAQDPSTLTFSGTIDYGTSQNLTIGNRSEYTPDQFWLGNLDELRIRNVVSSDDYIATQSALSPYGSNFQFGAQTAANPVKQFETCGASGAPATCVMPYDLSSGGIMAVVLNSIDVDCGTLSMSNDSAGNVYTRHVRSDYTGTLHHYYTCIYSAPITGTGADTVTSPNPSGHNISMTVYEVKLHTQSGVQTTFSNSSPPASLSLTATLANSFVICATQQSSAGTIGITETGYSFYDGPPSSSDDHPAHTMAAIGVTGVGARTCSLTNGNAAVMAMFNP